MWNLKNSGCRRIRFSVIASCKYQKMDMNHFQRKGFKSICDFEDYHMQEDYYLREKGNKRLQHIKGELVYIKGAVWLYTLYNMGHWPRSQTVRIYYELSGSFNFSDFSSIHQCLKYAKMFAFRSELTATIISLQIPVL